MQVKKFLVTSAAALSVVGAIGLAYAQTAPTPAQDPATQQQPMNQATPSTDPSTTGTEMNNSGTGTAADSGTERAAQADRN